MASQNLVAMEGEWILQGDGLVALAHDGEHNWFNVFLEDVLNRISRKMLLVRMKASKSLAPKSSMNPLRSVAAILHPDGFNPLQSSVVSATHTKEPFPRA